VSTVHRTHSLFLLLATVTAWTSGCAGEIADPEPFFQAAGISMCPLTDVHQELIIPKCGSCHSAELSSGGLDLTSADAPSRLLDTPATCGTLTKVLVDSANPHTGFLFDKLSPSPECGSQMPQAGTLNATEIACIKEWMSSAAGGN